MKWLKIPLDDDVYQVLEWMADALGSSPEELVMRLATGSVRGYVELMAKGNAEEVKQILLNPATKKAMEAAFREKIPKEPDLWTP